MIPHLATKYWQQVSVWLIDPFVIDFFFVPRQMGYLCCLSTAGQCCQIVLLDICCPSPQKQRVIEKTVDVFDSVLNFMKVLYHCLGEINALKHWKWCSETSPFVGGLPRWCGTGTQPRQPSALRPLSGEQPGCNILEMLSSILSCWEKSANLSFILQDSQGWVQPRLWEYCKCLNCSGPCLCLFLAAYRDYRSWLQLKNHFGEAKLSLFCQLISEHLWDNLERGLQEYKDSWQTAFRRNKKVRFLWDEKRFQEILFLFLNNGLHCQWEASFSK